MRLPREISAGAAARRRLLADVLLGIAIGVAAIVLAAGVGVAGFFALLCLIVLAASYLAEGAVRAVRRRSLRHWRRP